MFNNFLAEAVNLCQGFLPVDMAAGANDGDYISLKNYRRCAVILFKEPGVAGNDPVITLTQALNVAGSGTTKPLTVQRVWKKQAATNLLAVGQYTKSTPADPAANDTFSTNTWTNSDLAEQAGIIIVEVMAEDLDIANGYDCFKAAIADVGTAGQVGALLYALYDPKFQSDPLPSGIVD
ncbi:MAG: hypothetical protein KIS96_03550 [Bauldia sp.]|nr:hypothetical protein [Bauldia sp.]